MTFWPRALSALICCFLTILPLVVVAEHYFILITTDSLGLKVLLVLVTGASTLVVLFAVFAFWFWVWTRGYSERR